MKFGYTDNIEGIDFKLPQDPDFTKETLTTLSKNGNPEIYVGCPVWADKSYVGRTYPPKTPQKNFLTEYGKQFNSIEVNATRYGVPKQSTLDKWRDSVPDGFKFFFKVPQIISHSKDIMSESAQARMDRYFEAVYSFGDKAGTGFIILPHYFTTERMYELEQYLKIIPKEVLIAFEFRNKDMATSVEVAQLLREYKMPMIITDTPGERDFVHNFVTTDKVFIRFVGVKLHPSDFSRIEGWMKTLKRWMDAGVSEVGFFMHQPSPYKYLSADLARYFIEQLEDISAANKITVPTDYSKKLH